MTEAIECVLRPVVAQLAAAMPAAAKSRTPGASHERPMRLSPEPQEAETPPRSARRKRRSKAASGSESELSGGLAREVSVMQRLSDRLATAAGAEEQLAQERVARERPSRAAAPRAAD